MTTADSARICVAIGRRSTENALDAAKNAESVADVLEIRLDILDKPDVKPFISSLNTPLLFTCRPEWEGGNFKGSEEERINLLIQAVKAGAAYVDLELLAPEKSHKHLAQALKGQGTKLILSNHNFSQTGSRDELLQVLQSMKKLGADIGKIISTAQDFRDVLRILQLQEDALDIGLPLITFCMGECGVISRFATLELGGYMTYCAVDKSEATAPGQLTAQTVRDMLASLKGQ